MENFIFCAMQFAISCLTIYDLQSSVQHILFYLYKQLQLNIYFIVLQAMVNLSTNFLQNGDHDFLRESKDIDRTLMPPDI